MRQLIVYGVLLFCRYCCCCCTSNDMLLTLMCAFFAVELKVRTRLPIQEQKSLFNGKWMSFIQQKVTQRYYIVFMSLLYLFSCITSITYMFYNSFYYNEPTGAFFPRDRHQWYMNSNILPLFDFNQPFPLLNWGGNTWRDACLHLSIICLLYTCTGMTWIKWYNKRLNDPFSLSHSRLSFS